MSKKPLVELITGKFVSHEAFLKFIAFTIAAPSLVQIEFIDYVLSVKEQLFPPTQKHVTRIGLMTNGKVDEEIREIIMAQFTVQSDGRVTAKDPTVLGIETIIAQGAEELPTKTNPPKDILLKTGIYISREDYDNGFGGLTILLTNDDIPLLEEIREFQANQEIEISDELRQFFTDMTWWPEDEPSIRSAILHLLQASYISGHLDFPAPMVTLMNGDPMLEQDADEIRVALETLGVDFVRRWKQRTPSMENILAIRNHISFWDEDIPFDVFQFITNQVYISKGKLKFKPLGPEPTDDELFGNAN